MKRRRATDPVACGAIQSHIGLVATEAVDTLNAESNCLPMRQRNLSLQ